MLNYYDRPEISNSLLNAVKRFAQGQASMTKISPYIASFGTQFHTNVLEPHLYNADLDHAIISAMGDSARNNHVMSLFLGNEHTVYEEEKYFIHERTGLACKCKIDARMGIWIADLKSTSCKTKEDFLIACEKYGYFRQAAFYLDAAKASTMFFIGVCKTDPHLTFTVQLEKHHPLIERGRTEYENLLDLYVHYTKQGIKFAA